MVKQSDNGKLGNNRNCLGVSPVAFFEILREISRLIKT
jgi:hypothetical protein